MTANAKSLEQDMLQFPCNPRTGFRYSKLLEWLFGESLQEETCSESPASFSKVKPSLANIICEATPRLPTVLVRHNCSAGTVFAHTDIAQASASSP